MKLSIIIPVYNEAPYLKRCLDSIVPNKDIEVIVIDDHSTDGSGDICDEYRNIFRIIHLPAHSGVSVARNIGILEASGRYLTFLDSDDEYTPHGIETMLKAVDTFWSQPMVQFNHLRHIPKKSDIQFPRNLNASGMYSISNLPHYWMGVWNKIFLTSFIRNNALMFNRLLDYGEDEVFVLNCLQKHQKIHCVEDCTVIKHVQNPNSLSKMINKNKLIMLSEELLYIASDPDNSPEYDELMRHMLAVHWSSKNYKKHFGNIAKGDQP